VHAFDLSRNIMHMQAPSGKRVIAQEIEYDKTGIRLI
jgi:hypothetical protein